MMPALPRLAARFVGHGSPMKAREDTPITRAWRTLSDRIDRPRTILSISAPWGTKSVLIAAAASAFSPGAGARP